MNFLAVTSTLNYEERTEMKPIRRGASVLLAILSLMIPMFVFSGTAHATSDYDSLLHTTPSLFVYTDGAAKSQKMDISQSWLDNLRQTYAKRVAQNIGFPTNFMTELDDIVSFGGSLGVFLHVTSDGNTVEIVGSRDPHAYCGFVGDASTGSYQCTSHAGYGYIHADYFTHNSFGGNGCVGSNMNLCSDNDMNIYDGPQVQTGTAGYSFLYIQDVSLPDYRFYFMHFDLTYPTGYAGVMIPTSTPPAQYVAMGDSFSSGEGNAPFEAGTDTSSNKCHRSPQAYPRLLENNSSLDLGSTAFVACSGATTSNVLHGGSSDGAWGENPQIDALSTTTKVVTITIGGNDVGFKDFATACTVGSCDFATTAYSDIHGKITNDLPGALADVYNAIDNATPSTADIYVVGYPQIAPAEMPTGMNSACYPLNGGADNPDPALNDGATAHAVVSQLNSVIHDAVNDMNLSKFHFVDPNLSGSPFIGHDWCQQDRYFDEIGIPIPPSNTEYSFHPNQKGQEAYKTIVEGAIS